MVGTREVPIGDPGGEEKMEAGEGRSGRRTDSLHQMTAEMEAEISSVRKRHFE